MKIKINRRSLTEIVVFCPVFLNYYLTDLEVMRMKQISVPT